VSHSEVGPSLGYRSPDRLVAGQPDSDGLFPTLPVPPVRALSHDTHVRDALNRNVDHAQHGLVFADQRNIDRELAVPFDELLGSVERIHEPVLRPACPDCIVDLSGFL
jgi:hypothetical protein